MTAYTFLGSSNAFSPSLGLLRSLLPVSPFSPNMVIEISELVPAPSASPVNTCRLYRTTSGQKII